jgi:hypothetical protein
MRQAGQGLLFAQLFARGGCARVSLMEISIANQLSEELSSDVDFGAEDLEGFRANVGDAPIGITLSKLRAQLGDASAISLLLERFELALIPHRFSLIKTKGWAEVINAGIQISYELGDKTCSVISLLPEYEYIKLGDFSFGASVSAKGEAALATPELAGMVPVTAGAELKSKLAADSTLTVRGQLVTPRISAVGKGSRRCEWQFSLGDMPLYGRDIETWAVLALPANLPSIDYRLKLNVTQRTAFIPSRWESDEYEVRCEIVR